MYMLRSLGNSFFPYLAAAGVVRMLNAASGAHAAALAGCSLNVLETKESVAGGETFAT